MAGTGTGISAVAGTGGGDSGGGDENDGDGNGSEGHKGDENVVERFEERITASSSGAFDVVKMIEGQDNTTDTKGAVILNLKDRRQEVDQELVTSRVSDAVRLEYIQQQGVELEIKLGMRRVFSLT